MESSRRRVGELLWIFGLSRVTAPIWEMLRGGKSIRQSRRMQEFYSSLVPDGALVFDLGANVGTMTRVFSSLGARILAVEPNPDCVRHIELTTSRKAVEVLQAAVSDTNGLAVLKVSDRKDKMSSLSDEWRDTVSKQNADYVGMWNRELTVPSVTLDTLTERCGRPYYIKIDVEGHEEQVIQGLSHLPPLLSFEFNRHSSILPCAHLRMASSLNHSLTTHSSTHANLSFRIGLGETNCANESVNLIAMVPVWAIFL